MKFTSFVSIIKDTQKIRINILQAVDSVNESDDVNLDDALMGIHSCGKFTKGPLISQAAVKTILRKHETLSFEFERFPKWTLVDMFTEIRLQLRALQIR